MDIYTSIVGFFQTGGMFMYPIAFILTIGLVIALERWLFLSTAKHTNKRAFSKIQPLLKERKYDQLYEFVKSSSAPVSKIILAGMMAMHNSRRKDDLMSSMQESALETVPRMEKRTPYLATLANVATLLGLLGTIIGLISAFTAVADADPSTKATLLSQSISVAMNTTAFGLISAIPLLLIHAVLQSKTTEIIDSLDIVCMKFVNSVSVVPDSKQNTAKNKADNISAAA